MNANKKLTKELEYDIRSKVNPQYKDTLGTESYERDALLKEIDRLRALIEKIHAKLEYGDVYRWDDGDECWSDMRRVVEKLNDEKQP